MLFVSIYASFGYFITKNAYDSVKIFFINQTSTFPLGISSSTCTRVHLSFTLIIHLANKLSILYNKIIITKLRKKIEKKMHITLSNVTLTTNMHACFLFIYFYFVKFSCQKLKI